MTAIQLEAPSKKRGDPTVGNFAMYQTTEGLAMVRLSQQRTGYGQKNFLVCPVCGARRTTLFISDWNVACRDHLVRNGRRIGGYYGVTHTTRGGHDRLEYTMRKMGRKHDIEINPYDFDPFKYISEDRRPRYMRKRKFADLIARLAILYLVWDNAVYSSCPLFGRRKNNFEGNVEIIRFVERASPEELCSIETYRREMSFAQYRYNTDWGFPEVAK